MILKHTARLIFDCIHVLERFKLGIVLISLLIIVGCQPEKINENIDISKAWHFSPDENNKGEKEGWFAVSFDDSHWKILDAGIKWEEQGFPDLDSYGWYRKSVTIPKYWKGQKIWLKFEAVNDAYTLFINGEKLSFFGEANISIATRQTFTEIYKKVKFGKHNQIALRVKDWVGTGG